MSEVTAFDDLRFTIGDCASCARTVLTYTAFDLDEEAHRCVHCDKAVTSNLSSTAGEALPDHGYGLLEAQGCGNPECGGGACMRLNGQEPT